MENYEFFRNSNYRYNFSKFGFSGYWNVRGGQEGSDKMFNSLRFRTALSVFLFVALMFASYMGWIAPNNILPTQ